MIVKIRKCDHTGDSVLAEYETEDDKSVDIAQEELTSFLDSCVKQYGTAPPVWGKRIGESDFVEIDSKSTDHLRSAEEVLVHPMIIGG